MFEYRRYYNFEKICFFQLINPAKIGGFYCIRVGLLSEKQF